MVSPELISKGADRYVQDGLPLNALSVRQIPPPAAESHKRQLVELQVGEIANAFVLPAEVVAFGTYCVVSLNSRNGTEAKEGPTVTHEPFAPCPFANPLFLTA